MATSGQWRTTAELFIECACGWCGLVEAIEDTEDMSLSWVCGGCGWPEIERY